MLKRNSTHGKQVINFFEEASKQVTVNSLSVCLQVWPFQDPKAYSLVGGLFHPRA